jgi:large subunit ribosomal protein L21
MKYAVIRIRGKQYKVAEGEEFFADFLGGEEPKLEVLLVVNDDKIKVGTPKVRGAKVSLKVLEPEVKGNKLYVQKYRSKSRYRRKIGFRPRFSKLLVKSIS